MREERRENSGQKSSSMKIWIGLGIVLLIAVILGFWVMSIYNGEVELRNRYLAQEKVIETTHDNMWKTIKQKYKISDKYENAFKDGLKTLVVGRQGGSLFKSSGEANTQLGLPTDLYKDMMNTIEGKRAEFKRSQDTFGDIWRQHKTYIETTPNSIFVGSKTLEEPKMITSTTTEGVIKSGKDDDISFE